MEHGSNTVDVVMSPVNDNANVCSEGQVVTRFSEVPRSSRYVSTQVQGSLVGRKPSF